MKSQNIKIFTQNAVPKLVEKKKRLFNPGWYFVLDSVSFEFSRHIRWFKKIIIIKTNAV